MNIDWASFTPGSAAIGGIIARGIDRRLVLGSLAFGVGWGLAGFCPGPAPVALGAGKVKAQVFVAAMLAECARSSNSGARERARPSA